MRITCHLCSGDDEYSACEFSIHFPCGRMPAKIRLPRQMTAPALHGEGLKCPHERLRAREIHRSLCMGDGCEDKRHEKYHFSIIFRGPCFPVQLGRSHKARVFIGDLW